MEIRLTPAALSFLAETGANAVSVSSLVFSSCCSGPLPPEVKPGPPNDTDGFLVYASGDLTIYFDTLLDPKPELMIDLKDFGLYRELFVDGWE